VAGSHAVQRHWPAGLVIPARFAQNGLPRSVQFVGRDFGEATLFQVAREWEREAGTDNKHPPVL
jgi:aspartyl-tRNA(Asn)/glutamyl-tRNA(Gln) amidotransferase subunit A